MKFSLPDRDDRTHNIEQDSRKEHSHTNREAGLSGNWSRGLKLYTDMCTNCEWMKGSNNQFDLSCNQIVDKLG
eukprot:6000123-Heterocapsa_arctica.AAC.1